MKKQLFFFILLIIFGLQLNGQKTNDVLYLKNGSKIYGKLIEADSSQFKFQTSDGSVMIYTPSEVEKFTKETPLFEGRKSNAVIISLETGVLIGPQNAIYSAPFSFDCQFGYIFSTGTSLSLSSGVLFVGRPFTPLLVEFRQLINNRKVSPYIFTRGGAIIPLGSDYTGENETYYYDSNYNIPMNYKGGGSFSIGTGISWAYDDYYELNLSFAYRYAHYSYRERDYQYGYVTYKENLNRLEMKLGFRF